MAHTSSTFELVARALEDHTGMNRLQARGTIRLSLKKAGLDVSTVTEEEMLIVLTDILPRELARRGVAEPQELCGRIAEELKATELEPDDWDSPEEIFERVFWRKE